MRTEVVAVILGMAGLTYLTRISGFWLIARVTPTPRVRAWLEYLPGCILAALVAPMAFAAGVAEAIAAVLVAIIVWRTNNILAAVVIGTIAVVGLRAVL